LSGLNPFLNKKKLERMVTGNKTIIEINEAIKGTKNKLLTFIISCLIVMPIAANVNKNGAATVTIKKEKENKRASNLTKPKKIKLSISARVLFASKTTQKNKKSASQLKNGEKELTGYLDYNDYKVLKSGSKTVKLKKSFKRKAVRTSFRSTKKDEEFELEEDINP